MTYSDKPGSPEEMLAHYGVKGMRWGERRAHRKQMKALDKASLARDRAERNAAIDKARARVASGQTGRDAKAAKAEYKVNKHVIGKREARKILQAKRDILDTEYELSNEIKTGREATVTILSAAGGVAIATAASSALARAALNRP